MKNEYQECINCVMDTSDPEITFDENGVCSHCYYYKNEVQPRIRRGEEGKKTFLNIVNDIKKSGRNKEYDCILGLSGGVDSSFVALKLKEHNIRPLAVHVDAGWNTETAVNNIKAVVDYCNYDLHTIVVDWDEMRDLQISYLKSGVSNQDVPQDHVFFAALYSFAVKNSMKYVISGGNLATEGIFPKSWHYNALDGKNLKHIHKTFARKKIKKLPTMSLFQYYIFYPFIKGLKVIRPLDFMDYSREEALRVLTKIGFKEYGDKHCESIFTKFFQRYYLPVRYGYDKRRPHLSSQILSGLITREEAVRELQKPLYEEQQLEQDKCYIRKKLGISEKDFEEILKVPRRRATDFPSGERFYIFIKSLQKIAEKKYNVSLRKYSTK